MGFLSPLFLGGLLAAALPIYVHLLRQHKTTPLHFSSLMFFERRMQSSVKHRRLKYLALLAMRLAIILLLALLFANPYIRTSAATGEGGRKLMVFAIDNSFSMRAGDRLSRAKQEALSALGQFRPGDRGQVLSFSNNAQILTQQIESPDELRAAIQSIQPGDGRSAYGEIARTLRSLVPPGGLPVEAHIFTDMQRSSMPTPFAELAVPPNLKLELHALVDRREPNWFVETVNVPATVFQPKKVRVQATVAGASADPSETNVSLVLNTKVLETKRVTIPAGGRTTVEFFLPDAAYGHNRGEVRIESKDALPGDDRFLFALERKEAGRVLFVYDGRSERSATYYRAAIESVPDAGFTPEVVSASAATNLGLDKFAAVVLSDVGSLPGALESALTDYVKRGGGLLVALGPASAVRDRVPVTGDSIAESRYTGREAERFQAAAEVDIAHPALARVGQFENVKFYQTVKADASKGRVIAKLTDGAPLVFERKIGEGRVLVFTSGLDNVANDLPLRASFVPFVEQSAQYLSGYEAAPAQYAVDSFVELRAARDAGSAAEVLDPDGKRTLSLKEAASAQAVRLGREGFWEIRRANGRNGLIAVHADRRESDLDVIPVETQKLWQGTGSGSPASQRESVDGGEKPFSLWWYFAFALLCVTAAEALFSSRYLAAEQEPVVRKRAA